MSAPEASGYDFQTSGVVKMHEKLLNEFIAERTTLEKEELNTKQAYEMLMQSLNAQLGQAKSNVEIKSGTKVRSCRPKQQRKGTWQTRRPLVTKTKILERPYRDLQAKGD